MHRNLMEIILRIKTIFSKEHIDDIVNIAESDPDEWVKVAANIVKDYPKPPSTLALSTSSFQETLDEIISESMSHLESVLWIVRNWIVWFLSINPFHATDLFLSPLKTSENLGFSDVPGGIERLVA